MSDTPAAPDAPATAEPTPDAPPAEQAPPEPGPTPDAPPAAEPPANEPSGGPAPTDALTGDGQLVEEVEQVEAVDDKVHEHPEPVSFATVHQDNVTTPGVQTTHALGRDEHGDPTMVASHHGEPLDSGDEHAVDTSSSDTDDEG